MIDAFATRGPLHARRGHLAAHNIQAKDGRLQVAARLADVRTSYTFTVAIRRAR